MSEQELIKQIAQPIIDQILKLEEQAGSNFLIQCPQIRLISDDSSEYMSDQEYSYNDLLLKKVETYIQNELEAWFKPTVLH